jgi:hypothetical protein
VRTFVDKSLGRAKPYTACAPGDDGDFIPQSRHRLRSLDRAPEFGGRSEMTSGPGFRQ